jgi:imidazolonepropionase-like amidohydrolase
MWRLPFVFLLACGGGKPEPPIKALAGDVVFTNVTVVPMDKDTTVPGQSVIVRGDKIVAIAPAKRIVVDAGTEVKGDGKWLMPGLADMHVHTWTENDLTLFVAAGVTTIRNMYGGEQHLAWRGDIAAGKKFGPTMVTASPLVDGEPPVWPGSIVATKPDEVDGIVAGIKGQGYDFIKPYSRLEKPVYEALAAAAKKHGLTLQGHTPKSVGIEGVLAAGQKSIEHLDGWFYAIAPADDAPPGDSYWKALSRVLKKADETKIPAVANDMKKAGTWNCPTLIVTSRFAELEDIAALEKTVKWLELIAPETRAQWNPKADFRLKSVDAADYAAMREANEMRKKMVRVLATSGAPLLVGTDAGNPYVLPGEGLHDEIELMVAAGAPRPRVMRAATADAATFLGKQGAAGVIAAGAAADLLLVSVDPMTTPLPLVPDGVVLRGKWIPKADLDAKLAAIAKPADAPKDRFAAMPALAPEGTDAKQAHYDLRSKQGDKIIGEERLAVGLVDGKRVVVAQAVTDQPGHIETTYRIAGLTAKVDQKTAFGSISLEAKPDGKKLVVTGKAAGKDVTLDKELPKDAFMGAPGIGGTIELAAKLKTMKVGDKRTAVSVEISTFPRASIEEATYELARLPDEGGNRKFSITLAFGAMKIESELVIDANDIPVTQSFRQPLDVIYVRR